MFAQKLSLFEKYYEKRPEFANLDLGLSRIDAAAKAAIGEIGARVIHVAGTNGKGSTSFFLAQLLRKEHIHNKHTHGANLILFTSPHIINIRERIQQSVPTGIATISAVWFDDLFLEVKPYIEEYRLSYFETLYLMALMLCKQIDPDYLILETGLGGRYDATNSNIISIKTPVITSLSQDHKELLGHKITDIIGEKAAIIGKNSPVFVAHNPVFVMDKLRQSLPDADFRPVDLSRLSEARAIYSDPYSFNYLIAHQVAEYLLCRKLPLQKLALPPCRQERFGRIMLDGAHNASGILTLLKGLEGRGELPEVAIISMTAERDIERFCGLFAQKIPHILTTVIPHNPRSVSMDTLAKLPYKSFDSPSKALAYAEKTFSGRILVAGSLYLCALLRQKLVK